LSCDSRDGEIPKITRILRSDEYYPPGIKVRAEVLHPSDKEIVDMIEENLRKTTEKSRELLNKDSKPPPSTSTSPPQQ
jgi:hypothetical protein